MATVCTIHEQILRAESLSPMDSFYRQLTFKLCVVLTKSYEEFGALAALPCDTTQRRDFWLYCCKLVTKWGI